jgi:hypothetical protein
LRVVVEGVWIKGATGVFWRLSLLANLVVAVT